MKNVINYYYNIIVSEFKKRDDSFIFNINENVFEFVQYYGDINRLFNLYNLLKSHRKETDEIIFNKDKNIITYYENIPYILLKKYNISKKEINLSDIVWCYLSYHTDVESPTTYYLTLCLSNGAKHFINVYGRSYTDEYNALFYIALHLKDNAPHILFNFSNEYKKLYKQSPSSLTLLTQNSSNGSLRLSEWKQQKGLS